MGRWFWLTFAIGFGWSLSRLVMDRGWIIDDELSHYFISRSVWDDPRELLHPWSRPGRNLIQFVPSYFGLTAARLWTLALSAVAVWLTGREAKRLHLTAVWLLPLLIWFQWWFPELSYPVLTEAPFMLVWIAGIFFAVRQRMVLAALCFGALGLIRHEGIALAVLWGLWVVFADGGFARHLVERRVREAWEALPSAVVLGMWTALPIVVVNALTWRVRGELPFEVFFDSQPTERYASGAPWLYLQHLLIGAGVPVTILLVSGLARRGWEGRWDLVLYVTYPVYLVMHSVIYWRGLFASGGYYLFIMPMAPWIGLVALRGVEGLRERFGTRVLWVIIPLVIWSGLAMPQRQAQDPDDDVAGIPELDTEWKWIAPPLDEGRLGRGLRDATEWVEANAADEDWLAHHVAVTHFLDDKAVGARLEPWDERNTPEALTAGTVLIWDAKYSADFHDVSLERLETGGWDEVATYAHQTVRIFVKQ